MAPPPFVANMGMEWPTFNDFPNVWRPTWQWWTENGDNIKTKVLEILRQHMFCRVDVLNAKTDAPQYLQMIQTPGEVVSFLV